MILYRPVGETELKLIAESGFRAFPPRLPEQPIFYPVLNEKYAAEIAVKWNVNDANSGNRGYVTRFVVQDEYVKQFEIHTVGASYHQELWVSSEELTSFNANIIGPIELIATYT